MMITHHYLVIARNDDGENLDIMIEAESADQAYDLWKDFMELDETLGGFTSRIFLVPSLTGLSHVIGVDALAHYSLKAQSVTK